MPGTPRITRFHSVDSAETAPPMIPPWLYPMKWQSFVRNSGCPPAWKAVFAANPAVELISRPRNWKFTKPWSMWSTCVLNVDMSWRLRATLPMSCSDMPTQSVAQPMRSLLTPAENEPPSTSSALPRRPCPYTVGDAGPPGCSVDGRTQMKFAVHVLPLLIFGLPALSVVIFDSAVVSPRKSGTWNVPWMSRTPPLSTDDATLYGGG